jgi:hypothetical protein
MPTEEATWDARIWFRVTRLGPGTDPVAFAAWADRFGGPDLVRNQFVSAQMDSAELSPTQVYKNRYVTYSHEEDPSFVGGQPEQSSAQEILIDGLFAPGTKIDYFFTSNYVTLPGEYFYLPDTTDQFYLEYEILPRLYWDDETGLVRYPCILYVDAYNRGAQYFIELALEKYRDEQLPTFNWDRYDYLDASSNWKGPMWRRMAECTSGMTLEQGYGYRGIIMNTGTFGPGALESYDLDFLQLWLDKSADDQLRRALCLNGDQLPELIDYEGYQAFLNSYMGASFTCSPYRDPLCGPNNGGVGDSSYCVRIEDAPGSYYSPLLDYDVYGSGCPTIYNYNVIDAVGAGAGNRRYYDYDNTFEYTNYAQVACDHSAAPLYYRTVIDGTSYHHLSERDPVEECVGDSAHIIEAAEKEIFAQLDWVFAVVGVPTACDLSDASATDGELPISDGPVVVTKLFQNRPNPFNPRTVIKFGMASKGKVELNIYDVSGRLVSTLVNGLVDGGIHEVVWNGTNNAGEKVSSGVYWSQLKAGDYLSDKKMVLLK